MLRLAGADVNGPRLGVQLGHGGPARPSGASASGTIGADEPRSVVDAQPRRADPGRGGRLGVPEAPAGGWAYVRRWRALRLASSSRRAEEAPVWRLCCLLGALVAVLVALISPLD